LDESRPELTAFSLSESGVAWIRCATCNNLLGQISGGQVVVLHRGRELWGVIRGIRCEKCKTVWTPAESSTPAPGAASR
jgi:phage FluMu protein Com